MEANQGIHWIQRLSNFSLALSQLIAAVDLANQKSLSALEQQGMIYTFEYTHELSWNMLRDYVKDQGTQHLYAPKDTTHEAFSIGLIRNGEIWMKMIKDRNYSSQSYNLEIANATFSCFWI